MEKKEKEKNTNDYSFVKVYLKHKKKQLLSLTSALVKNSKRITWSNKQKLIEEFICVMFIVIFFAIFFYLIFLLISFLI